MKDPQKDVPFTVLRATVGTLLLYGGPILAILLVLPTSQITSLGGFLDAMKTVFTVYGGGTQNPPGGARPPTPPRARQGVGRPAARAFLPAPLSRGPPRV